MANHVWSVLCHKGCVDKTTNQISLLDVIEKVALVEDTVEHATSNDPEGAPRVLGRIQMQLVSWWIRSDVDQPETSRGRLAIIDVDGKEFGANEMDLLMEDNKGWRTIIQIPGIPMDRGEGTMWFVVSQQDGENWEIVARIPLEVGIPDETPQAEM